MWGREEKVCEDGGQRVEQQQQQQQIQVVVVVVGVQCGGLGGVTVMVVWEGGG